MRNLFESLTNIGCRPEDTSDVRVRKRYLVLMALMILPAGLIWGAIYWLFGEPFAAAVPWLYVIASSVSLIMFALNANYSLFRFTELGWILIAPFVLGLILGGFVNSSAVFLWSLLAPIGALIFYGARQALYWFVAYLVLILIGSAVQPYLRTANNLPQLVQLAFFLLNIGAISAVAFLLLYFFIRERNSALEQVRIEREKSENLLLNILPKEIAPRLKDNPGTIADRYDCASILFADIVDFTPWSAELAPDAMVEMLNEIFSYFDSLLDKYGVEKIRTIGDNYMCAAGVPVPRPDHAQTLARMALDMRDYIEACPPRNGKHLNFRIGINSGPLVAGVIGTKKFVYDIWGDPVNVAARMESHSVPGKIQVGRPTYELIKDEFICEPRGVLDVKGKGKMETWFLIAEKNKTESVTVIPSEREIA
ncbi:MAG TPA: adenylate/guanylate cyclase domain-containing protein [Anaerolineae bacterium]|nr:adenylate/guanylate cyclase domain-containing protein [Anaerolineae bacterium]